MKFFHCLALVLAVGAVNAEITDINSVVDIGLAKFNEYLRAHSYTGVHLANGSFGSHVSFSDSDVLGLDSLKRTSNCTLEIVGENATLDFHYGFGFFQQSFKYMNIKGQGMSASYRIRDNSARLYFTVNNYAEESRCNVTLHDVSYERMAGVEFHSSWHGYDGIKLDAFFKDDVVPYLNNKINKAAIEKALERFACELHLDISQHVPLIHQTILEQSGAFFDQSR